MAAPEELFTSLVLPSLISGIIAFLIFGLARFTKTSNSTVTGAVKLEAMKNDFSDMEKSMNKVLDNIHDVITQEEREQRRKYRGDIATKRNNIDRAGEMNRSI